MMGLMLLVLVLQNCCLCLHHLCHLTRRLHRQRVLLRHHQRGRLLLSQKKRKQYAVLVVNRQISKWRLNQRLRCHHVVPSFVAMPRRLVHHQQHLHHKHQGLQKLSRQPARTVPWGPRHLLPPLTMMMMLLAELSLAAPMELEWLTMRASSTGRTLSHSTNTKATSFPIARMRRKRLSTPWQGWWRKTWLNGFRWGPLFLGMPKLTFVLVSWGQLYCVFLFFQISIIVLIEVIWLLDRTL